MELTVRRKYFKPTYTIGWWYANNTLLDNSLEDKDRGITQNMPTAEIYKKKVYGQTAIGTGRYRVRLSVSPKFSSREWARKYNGLVPEILDVPGFSGIRIHPGSNCASTSGCVLIGRNTIKGQLTESVKCYYRLMDEYIIPAVNRGEEIWITIE